MSAQSTNSADSISGSPDLINLEQSSLCFPKEIFYAVNFMQMDHFFKIICLNLIIPIAKI